jgi:hypothetical protein
MSTARLKASLNSSRRVNSGVMLLLERRVMKLLIIIISCFLLVASVYAEDIFWLKTENTSAEALIESASVVVNEEKRTFSVNVVIKNIGDKPIQGVRCEYETEEVVGGEKHQYVTSGGVIWIKPLPPNESRKFILLDEQTFESANLSKLLHRVSNRNGIVRLTEIQFIDDSVWKSPAAKIDME